MLLKLKKSSLLISAFLLNLSFSTFAQMTIQFPTERAVFQRDLNNQGNIYISGSISQKVDKIEARLLEYKDGSLIEFLDWTAIENKSDIGSFKGKLTVKGGWYQLRVRAFVGEKETFSKRIEKVGVGEVFIISGQSNAQGVPGYGGTGAKDDRVNSANFLNDNFSKEPNTDLTFSQLSDNSNIGPIGLTPWCWGQVGDSLAKKLDVPIMFFNTALTRTLSSNWYQSSLNLPTKDAIFQGFFELGFPYQYLETTMRHYASLFGIRAVLWHQGETDTYPGVPVEEEIFGYYKGVIAKIRADFGHNMAWMFSRVSYSEGRTSEIVLKAHDRIINLADFNVYEGPSTDGLMIPRFDGVHFGNTAEVKGLELLAGAWLEKLNTNFFDSCEPIILNPLVDLSVECFQGNQAKVSAPSDHMVYKWSDGNTENLRLASSGSFSANLTNALGNYKIGTAVNLNAVSFLNPEVFTAKKFICDNEKLVLSSDARFKEVLWNNESETAAIEIDNGGTFSYTAKNAIGCDFTSESIIIEDVPLPVFAQKIGITVDETVNFSDNSVGFCEGTEIALAADLGFDNYLWTDGFSTRVRTLNNSAVVSYKGVYSPGCVSDESPILSAVRYDNPLKPTIFSDALFDVSASIVTDYDGFRWKLNGELLTGNTSTIKALESGLYSVEGFKNYGENTLCFSDESEVFQKDLISVASNVAYPNPAVDNVYIESPGVQTNVKVSLFDKIGKSINPTLYLPIWENRITIPVGQLSAGVYILLLESDQSLLRKKIVIP